MKVISVRHEKMTRKILSSYLKHVYIMRRSSCNSGGELKCYLWPRMRKPGINSQLLILHNAHVKVKDFTLFLAKIIFCQMKIKSDQFEIMQFCFLHFILPSSYLSVLVQPTSFLQNWPWIFVVLSCMVTFFNHWREAYTQLVDPEVGITGVVPHHPVVTLIFVAGRNN